MIVPLLFVGKTVVKGAIGGSQFSIHCTHPENFFGFQCSSQSFFGGESMKVRFEKGESFKCFPLGSLGETESIKMRFLSGGKWENMVLKPL